MSASEKLKALDKNLHPAPWEELWVALNPPDDPEWLIPLRNALPQIVAVVEAAESLDAEMKRYADGEEPDAEQYAYRQLALWKSLAALDEALG